MWQHGNLVEGTELTVSDHHLKFVTILWLKYSYTLPSKTGIPRILSIRENLKIYLGVPLIEFSEDKVRDFDQIRDARTVFHQYSQLHPKFLQYL